MTAQFIHDRDGRAVWSCCHEAEYAALLAIAEDAEDGEIVREFKRKLAARRGRTRAPPPWSTAF